MTWTETEAADQIMLVLALAATVPDSREQREQLGEALGPFIDHGPTAMFGLVCACVEVAHRMSPRPLRPGDGQFLALEVSPSASAGERAAGQIFTAFLNGDVDTAADIFGVLATREDRAEQLVDVLLLAVGMAAAFIRQKMAASG